MIEFSRRIANSETFQTLILWLILLTAVSMGLETVPELTDQYGAFFDYFFLITQVVFGLEIVIRLLAYAPRYRKFFGDFWNTFDFVIVVVSFLPGIGSFALVARLLRVLRVLRIISVSDKLRSFADSLYETFDEIAYAGIITATLGYIFTIAGNYLFFEVAPEHWGTFGRSALSVFYLLLLQDIPQFVDAALRTSPFAIAYFLAFYLVFIGLLLSVVSSMITQTPRKR